MLCRANLCALPTEPAVHCVTGQTPVWLVDREPALQGEASNPGSHGVAMQASKVCVNAPAEVCAGTKTLPWVQGQFGLGNPTAGLIAVWQVCCKEALHLHA